ncbi:uncharacterized protein I303_106271 [Kwoniella dejecticola CBS 10117]|uniref:Uncharacterized protein n=1 Tax=Kwoniella dejecticola CBS 10117 TaxID=1296121 RepID=A0A1A6A1R7_9TREE|nr:uncharacterized protein I303_06290 [Kwoniella dejecticola CBS 10117]OBR84003.1 hypothetical protein I303_06290 [Kwoniella dejecticola CBS 10117]
MSQPPRTYHNPFYTAPAPAPAPSAGSTGNPASPPPSYNHSTRPQSQPQSHPQSNEPVQYGSLSQLNKGRTVPAPPSSNSASAFTYTPDPSRQGYRTYDEPSQSSTGGRRVPPVNREGVMPPVPPEPPRRNVASSSTAAGSTSTPTGQQSYLKQAQGYIPERAQNTIGAAADKVNDSWRSIATNERKDQVMSGLGKLGVGAAKLTAKGAYQIGKFASK